MKCKDCPYWQRNGDCYRIVGYLEPNLFKSVGEGGMPFRIPFDPHDVKYFINTDWWFEEHYKRAIAEAKRLGIEVEKVREEDVMYYNNQAKEDMAESLVDTTLYYFKTKGDFDCESI